jgi:hypothetical protein
VENMGENAKKEKSGIFSAAKTSNRAFLITALSAIQLLIKKTMEGFAGKFSEKDGEKIVGKERLTWT